MVTSVTMAQKIVEKHTDMESMEIHWKALEEHCLMVALVF
jgi:hypothetical protein